MNEPRTNEARGETIAIIPARGGSKGVPRKNVQRVGGIPLVARAIAAAREATFIDRVVVSTDDDEIAAVAREWGAEVVHRPASIAGDTATSESALLHTLETLSAEVGIVVFLQATSPFIASADLDRAVAQVADGEFDCVFSAHETYGFLWRSEAGRASGINHEASYRPRRQDREPHYLETGAFYVMDAALFRAAKHRFFGRIGVALVAESSAIEIDTVEQLHLAQAIARLVDVNTAIDVDAVVTDFDGVHTDDTALVDADGHEHVRVSRSDGMGIALLRRAGIPVLILSTETNQVVTARAQKLRVDVRQGIDDKATALREWAAQTGVSLDRVAYLGNDVNDLPCLEIVGWPIAVPDSHPLVLAAARVMLTRPGGSGAVRELADAVVYAASQHPAAHPSDHPSQHPLQPPLRTQPQLPIEKSAP